MRNPPNNRSAWLAIVTVTAALAGAGCSDSGTPAAKTPTPSPTSAVATPTATTALVTLTGSCRLPGHGNQGLGPCAKGTAIAVFRCDDRAGCLHGNGLTMLATTTVANRLAHARQIATGDGQWSVQIAAADARASLIVEAAVADGVSYRTLAPCSGGTCAAEVAVDPVTEATLQLLDSHGFENYSDDGAAQVLDAVEQATAGLSFADETPASAPVLAVNTASADPTVTSVLVTASYTPTPTAAPVCCNCGGGCFQDSGNGCGDCTAVADAACIDAGCVAFTPTATSTATGSASATATASSTPTLTATPRSTATDTRTRPPTATRTITLTPSVTPTRTITLTPTPTLTASLTATATATVTATPTPTAATACNPSSCQQTTDCDCATHTSLFAIAHCLQRSAQHRLYRVTVAGWSTGTELGRRHQRLLLPGDRQRQHAGDR